MADLTIMLRAVAAAAALSLCALVLPGAPVGSQSAPGYPAPNVAVPVVTAHVVARFPHDPAAFTEGLLFHDGALYESVGQEGQSQVRRVRLADGKPTARVAIPASEFGEGLAHWQDQLVSLTWHEGIAHRWDARTLKPRGTSHYAGEGWGLTSDGSSLVLSDGTPMLRFLDPVTFAERRRITVTLDGRPLPQVNELEAVDGTILANIWHSGFIVRIDPASGRITQLIDLRPLVAEVHASDPEAVANGIAWDARGRRLFVTGKLWPTLFQIGLPAQQGAARGN